MARVGLAPLLPQRGGSLVDGTRSLEGPTGVHTGAARLVPDRKNQHVPDSKISSALIVKGLTSPIRDFSEHAGVFPADTRLCTKSHSFIGFLGVENRSLWSQKAFKMRLERSC